MSYCKLKIELVHWIDSVSRGGWASRDKYLEDAKDSLECRTVGFVMDETKDRLSLVLNESLNDAFDQMMTIPKCAIVSRKVLTNTEEEVVMPRGYEKMRDSFKRKGLSDKAAKTKAAKIWNSKHPKNPVTRKHKGSK